VLRKEVKEVNVAEKNNKKFKKKSEHLMGGDRYADRAEEKRGRSGEF